MNTTDYFTNINAMFLFCIFTCGLLVWAVIRGYILKGKLTKEQDSHLKATLINSELANELGKSQKDVKMLEEYNERLCVRIDEREDKAKEQIKIITELTNELEATKSKVRKRDKDGKFLPSGNARPKRVNKADYEKSYIKEANKAIDELNDAFGKIKELIDTQPKLIHGLTVKNPTEDEAKMIFDEARRLKIKVSKNDLGVSCPNIWVYYKKICVCVEDVVDYEWVTVVTAKDFVQRMQNGRG